VCSGVLSWVNVVTFYVACGNDPYGLLHPKVAMALNATSMTLFKWSMLCDLLGWYLLLLPVGGYVWSTYRATTGPMLDIATLCLTVYIALGVVGGSLQAAPLPAMVKAYGVADPSQRSALEAAWLGLVYTAQSGVWWAQNLPLSLWCVVTSGAMRRSGQRSAWILFAAGCCWAAYFGAAFFEFDLISEYAAAGGLALMPLWAVITGYVLLRHPSRTGMHPMSPVQT
jgi:hypothetical protein